MDNNAINKWLDDLARYFDTRDTHGEDRAHWANVYNAENARKVKAALSASEALVKELEATEEKHRELRLKYLAKIEELREALQPFAAIQPSIGVSQDGSEREPYKVFLACQDRFDFNGEDLARARAAYGETDGNEK